MPTIDTRQIEKQKQNQNEKTYMKHKKRKE
jgi:hypothetical protein